MDTPETPDRVGPAHDDPDPRTTDRPRRGRRARRLRRWFLYPLLLVLALTIGLAIVYETTVHRPSDPHEGHLALQGATVLVGPDLEPQVDTTVLVHDGVIVEVGPDDTVEAPQGATVIDLDGHTLLPGLFDMHVHLGMPELERGQQMGPTRLPGVVFDAMRYVPGARRAYLDHGVTTVRSLGDEHAWVSEMRRMVADGELEGPRVVAAGPVFTTPGGHPVVTFGVEDTSDSVRVPTTAAAARRAVRELAQGDDAVDLIKIVQERGVDDHRMQPHTPEVLTAIVEEAHAHGLPVTAHWGTPEDLDDVLAVGVDELQHIEARGVLGGWPDGVPEALAERGIALAPTLAVTEVALAPDDHQQLRDRAADLHTAGVRILVGSDAAIPGVGFGDGVHRELELLVDAGLTETEALRAATSEPADILGSEVTGAIEPGRAADLVAVAGDPLTDISRVRDVAVVLRDGRLVVDGRS